MGLLKPVSKNTNMIFTVLLLFHISFLVTNVFAQRKMEYLGRGTHAVRKSSSQVLVSWRIPIPEFYNGTTYNLYRETTRIASDLNVSNFVDNTSTNSTYSVAAVVGGTEQPRSPAVPVTTTIHGSNTIPSLKVPIKNTSGYTVGLIYVGDLDGDGEYDFVFTKQPSSTRQILAEAYLRDGTFLWQYDCGPNSTNQHNIQPGSSTLAIGHGDNITVYDINNDGKAEVIIRTANGSKFADGKVLSESNNSKQFISVLEGMTGKELGRAAVPTDYINAGPMNGHMGIAYLDGINPSVVWSAKNRNGSSGSSFNMMVTTYNWSNNNLVLNWKYLRTGNTPDGHNIRCIDVDGDGKDEIIPMGFCLRPNGTLLYSFGATGGLNHGDRFHIGDFDPSRPGIEGYAIQQDNPSRLAWAYYDAKTGAILQKQTLSQIQDLARGIAGDFDPRYPGYEFWTLTDGIYNVSGTRVSNKIPDSYPNLRIWWTGDLLSENLDNNKMTKWNHLTSSEERLYDFKSNRQWWRNVPGCYGDIFGDWREEVVYASDDGNSLLIFSTLDPTTHKIYTLPHNPGYRNCMNARGYYQSNMADFYLGDGMTTPPKPNIILIGQPPIKTLPAAVATKKAGAAYHRNEIRINADKGSQTTFTMYDLKGTVVYRQTVAGSVRIPVSSLVAKGNYIVHVKNAANELLLNKRISLSGI